MYFISYGEVGIIQDEDTATFAAQFIPVTLKRGKCFGEVALANKTTRTATVVCMEYTELLVIDKEDFNELKLENYIKLEQDGRLRCFSSIEPLERFSLRDLRKLVHSTKTDWFPINTVIKQATDIADTWDVVDHLNSASVNLSMLIPKKLLCDKRNNRSVPCGGAEWVRWIFA